MLLGRRDRNIPTAPLAPTPTVPDFQEPSRMWTDAAVKLELPEIRVSTPDDNIYVGHVRGRGNPFATVMFEYYGLRVTREVAWETVRQLLNSGRPLRVRR